MKSSREIPLKLISQGGLGTLWGPLCSQSGFEDSFLLIRLDDVDIHFDLISGPPAQMDCGRTSGPHLTTCGGKMLTNTRELKL